MNRLIMSIGLFLSVLTGCGPQPQQSSVSNEHSTLRQFAQSLAVNYRVITNRSDEACDATQTDGLCFQAELELTSSLAFSDRDWAIYFSNMAPVQMDTSELFDVIHINGDLHKIVPTKKFQGFEPQRTYRIGFRSGFWHLSNTDRMPNYYLTRAS